MGSRTVNMVVLKPMSPHCSTCACIWPKEDPIHVTTKAVQNLTLRKAGKEEYTPLNCTTQNQCFKLRLYGCTDSSKDDHSDRTLEGGESYRMGCPAKREARDKYRKGEFNIWETEFEFKNHQSRGYTQDTEYIKQWDRQILRGRRLCKEYVDNHPRQKAFQEFYSQCNILAGYGRYPKLKRKVLNQIENSASGSSLHKYSNSNLNLDLDISENETSKLTCIPEPVITQ